MDLNKYSSIKMKNRVHHDWTRPEVLESEKQILETL